jgi:type II secretory pathway component PulJ
MEKRSMMKIRATFNTSGLSLIELLVAFAISGMVIAGIYRVFTAQNKAYVVQDQVTEVQQSVRGAMDLIVRDLRMAGYDNNAPNSLIGNPDPTVNDPNFDQTLLVKIPQAIIPSDHAVTIIYEFDNNTLNSVTYSLNGNTLTRQVTTTTKTGLLTAPVSFAGPSQDILENVDAFNLAYGVDANGDGCMDVGLGWNGASAFYVTQKVGVEDKSHWTATPVAVQVTLSAKPDQTNEDVKKWVSPRTLTTIVELKNQTLIKSKLD